MRGMREDEVEGPFLKEKKPGCSSSVESKKRVKIFSRAQEAFGHSFGGLRQF